ncbi:lipoprotein insertase outer membrane protein LolB [Hydrocarboniclastica marina]|uniref:Outer-membrane lipoprotein LolB n=1 Tax=Hydrocarboniclastica marina TaxID=2259620 RepID=A0A4P7XF07_9ALTE|nr:lipoprotein insertase outer membrane protein LolB [Hydrocarboniclastica marina]QCF25235.1 outer membrane lipoprotein LolB [Hydrocarboniclastica marina]
MFDLGRRAGRFLLPGLVLLALTACSTRIHLPDDTGLSRAKPSDWHEREKALRAFDEWELIGKIAVRQADQSQSAIINRWSQQSDAYHLQLSSAFLGMGSVELMGDRHQLLIRTADGESYVSDDPEALVREVTGWRLPLAVLPYWVRGIPAPGQPSALGFGDQDTLKMLSQAGWDVYFERYSEPTERRPALPRLITATNGEARVRLAISRWQSQ